MYDGSVTRIRKSGNGREENSGTILIGDLFFILFCILKNYKFKLNIFSMGVKGCSASNK